MTQLALVIDLNKCVGCHACATNCKGWNSAGEYGPLTDLNPYDKEPKGVWFNRVQTYEVGTFPNTQVINFPKSCMHCRDPACVKACPTGASYKRAEDGVVLIDYNDCIGCKYCSWACPYGVREFDETEGVMKKCTLCADRIDNENLPEEERKPACVLACPSRARVFGDIDDPESEASKWVNIRKGYRVLPVCGTDPSNHYLPKGKVELELDEDELYVKNHRIVPTEHRETSFEEKIFEDIYAT